MSRFLSGKVIVYLIFLLGCDLTLVPSFRIGGFYPIFLYLAVVYAVFEWETRKAIAAAIASGILRDLTGSLPLGVETLTLGAATLGLIFLLHKIGRESVGLRMVLTFLFIFLVSLSVAVLSNFLGFSMEISWYTFSTSFAVAFSSAVVMPFFSYFAGRLFRDRIPLKQYELFG